MAPVRVSDQGFTIIRDGGSLPQLDIVFVHGLQGHPRKTWTYYGPKASDTSSNSGTDSAGRRKLSKLNPFSKRTASKTPGSEASGSSIDDIGVFWPEDLLPQHSSCQNARILTYGYDTNVIKMVETVNFTSIRSEGETLLNGLAAKRREDPHRPLMLITHSLGGLVVKKVAVPLYHGFLPR